MIRCRWCYVGKKRLEKGIAEYKKKHPNSNDTFSTTWFPFYLNPDAPKSIDKREYYYTKFGEARSDMIWQRLGELGKSEGINFKFGGKTGNTRDSHRLVQLGKTKGPQVQTRVEFQGIDLVIELKMLTVCSEHILPINQNTQCLFA